MPLARTLTRLLRCRSLACLLAIVIAVQGTSVAMWAAKGPAHVHAAGEKAPALADFRRELPKADVRHGGLMFWFGHAHGHAAAERHHHAPSDASALFTGDDLPAHALDAGAAMLLLALIPAHLAWRDAGMKQPRAFAPLWVAMTRERERLERPPRRV